MRKIATLMLFASALCLAQDEKPPAQDDKPSPTIPDLEAGAQKLYMRGDYEGARQALSQAWDMAQQLPREDPIRYDVLKRLAGVRAVAGEYADADNFLQLAISWREQVLGPDDPKIPDDTLLSVGYARAQKEYERALWIMRRVMMLHTRALMKAAGADLRPPPPPGSGDRMDALNNVIVADDHSRIAQIQMEMQKPEDAIGSLNIALEIRTKLLGPLDPSLVYDLDRLAGIQIMLRQYDKAEDTYRHALAVRETMYGKVHGDLLSTLDGLAYSLFGQKKYDDAEPVYQRFLALWIQQMSTDKNAMVAIALDKMAVFYGTQKKWDQARESQARANAIRAYLLADGLSNEASQRIDEGKMAEAIPLYERALHILDPPNPEYDELRGTIAGMKKELERVVNKPPARTPTLTKK